MEMIIQPLNTVFKWAQSAYQAVLPNALVWLLGTLVYYIATLLLSFLPVLGVLLNFLLLPFWVAGFLHLNDRIERGQRVSFMDFFWAFTATEYRLSLTVLAGLMSVATCFLMLLFSPLFGLEILSNLKNMSLAVAPILPQVLSHDLWVIALVMLPLSMLFLFAPALIIFKQHSPIQAMRESFKTCLKHLSSILLFLLLYTVCAMLAAIPYGLGFLVLLPTSMGMIYAAYCDLF